MKRLLVLVCLVTLAALLAPAASTAREPSRTARSASLTAPPGVVERGDTLRLAGRVTRTPRGGVVRVQQLRSGRWRTIATTRTTTARGAWSRTVRVRAIGTQRFRALVPATPRLRAATSRVLRVPVVPRAVPPRPEPGEVRRVTAGADDVVVSDDGATLAVETREALLPVDVNGVADIYLVNASDGATRLVSAHPDGTPATLGSTGVDLSGDASRVVFSTREALLPADTNGEDDVYVWQQGEGGTLAVVSRAGSVQSDRSSGTASISADGRFVAFASSATTLVSAAGSSFSQVYVRDLTRTGPEGVRLVTRQPGTQALTFAAGTSGRPSVASSGSGVSVAVESTAGLTTGTPTLEPQVFLSELDSGLVTTTLVSATPDGEPGTGASTTPDLARDREHVAFTSTAVDLLTGQVDQPSTLDVFVRDTSAPPATATVLASGVRMSPTAAAGSSYEPTLSADGDVVAFSSSATDLRTGALAGLRADRTQVWRRTLTDDVLLAVSRSHRRGVGNGPAAAPAVTADGEAVVFISAADDLVPGSPASGFATYVFRAGLL